MQSCASQLGRAGSLTVIAHSTFEPIVPAINVTFMLTTILTNINLTAWVNSTDDAVNTAAVLVNDTLGLSYNITGGNNGMQFMAADFLRTWL